MTTPRDASTVWVYQRVRDVMAVRMSMEPQELSESPDGDVHLKESKLL